MCDPTSLAVAGLVLGAGQAVAQKDAQDDLHAANKEIADANAVNQYSALQSRLLEERESAAQQINEANKRARLAVGEAKVLTNGATGLSLDSLYQSFERDRLDYESAVIRQQQLGTAQFNRDAKTIQANQSAQIMQVPKSDIGLPTFLGLGVGAYGNYLQLDTMKKQAEK